MFTKEYIELCKNESIQGLRPEFRAGDWFINPSSDEADLVAQKIKRLNFWYQYIWLPTSGQLEDEIIKICKEKREDYVFEFQINATYGDSYYVETGFFKNKIAKRSDNPLIAKIKLLIKLLESEWYRLDKRKEKVNE